MSKKAKPLALHLLAQDAVPPAMIEEGSQTAPAASTNSPDPQQQPEEPHRCPTCHSRDIARWRQWFEHNGEWIWHCHHVSQHRKGRPFCGHMWRTSRPIARCGQCGLTLEIEQHGGILGYWCGFCQDFSQ